MVSHRRAVLKKCEWRDSKKHGSIGSHILADTSQCSSAKRQVDNNPLTADRLRVRLLTDSVRLGTGIRTRHRHTNKMAAYMVSSSLSARQGYAPSARLAARAGASPVAVRAPLAVVAKQSRIGKKPVPVPKGVTYTLKDNLLAVKVRARPLSRTNSYGAARCEAITRSRRRPRPTPVASVHAASDRVLGFWLALFLTISSRLSAARLTGSQGRARIPVPRPHGHD